MGTRSITSVKDENGKKIIEIYQQYDGYPSGVGNQLLKFCNSGTLVNGINYLETNRVFNGMNCFAALLVSELKNGAGGVYLYAPTADYKNKKKYYEIYNADYYYEIDSNLILTCWDTCEDKKEII